jgi:hypothetical protein
LRQLESAGNDPKIHGLMFIVHGRDDPDGLRSESPGARMRSVISRFCHSLPATLVACLLLAACGLRAETFDIPRLDGITIDGDDGEWGDHGLHVSVMGRWQRWSPAATPSGEADLRVGWDERGVLLRLRMVDAQHLEDEVLWKLDAVEIFLVDQPGSASMYQAVLSPGLDEHFNQLRWRFYRDTRPPGSPIPTLTAARRLTADGYCMEVLLPWSDIGGSAVPSRTFGMQVIIDDADMSRDRADTETLCWFSDRNTYLDTSKVHCLRLSDAPGPAVLADVEFGTADGPERQLQVRTLAGFAGRTMTVVQGGHLLGSATLAAGAGHLSQASVRLDGCDPAGPAAEIRAGDAVIADLAFYRPLPSRLAPLLAQAMRTADEDERYGLIARLLADPGLDPLLHADLEQLQLTIAGWANNRRLAIAGKLADPDQYLSSVCTPGTPLSVRRDSPAYPLFCLYRARHLVWWTIEYGGIGLEERFFPEALHLLREAARSVPDNPVIAMYLGQRQPWPAASDADPNAPVWANAQREAIEKLTDIIHWWIDERQLPSGCFGGEWGDDCEMWRLWTPILIGFEDPAVLAAQCRMSEGVMRLPRMADGYTNEATDVEHTAEDSADAITAMMHLAPDDPQWRARAMRLADLMAGTWTGINQRGHRQFKNVVFSSRKVSGKEVDACDTIYHPRVVQPTLLLWQRTHDPALTALFAPWLDGWVAAAASSEHGKPAGIVPSAIHWPDGVPGGTGADWWHPGAFRDSPLYAWPSSMPILLNTLLLAYHVTGETRYLAPIRSMAEARTAYLATHPGREEEGTRMIGSLYTSADDGRPARPDEPPGSLAWCAARLQAPLNSGGTLAKYRFLTGDTTFDGLLAADANGYIRFRLTGDEAALDRSLSRAADAFSCNRAGFTSEVRFTDRVFRFPQVYLARIAADPPPVPDPGLLYSTLTGDPGDPLYCPMNAVRWLTEPSAFAALVTESGTSTFTAQLYHFGSAPRTMGAELFLLKPGRYRVTLKAAGAAALLIDRELVVSGLRTNLRFDLPPRTLYSLHIQ